MAPPTAIVTGGCSGIGLALTKHLLERNWNIVQADINPPKESLPGTRFIKCDVSSWSDNAALFQQAYAWNSRLDFCALNAGIDDRDDIFGSITRDPSKPPKKPSMQTLNIDLVGPYYGIKLAAHYMSLDSTAAGKKKAGGKVVVTSSAAGIFPFAQCPQYAMAKHGIVGLVRSLSARSSAVNIRINAVCPALVKSGLAPPGLLDSFTEEQFTPMSTILRAFDELAEFDKVGEDDWVEKGRSGETVEGNLDQLTYHQPPNRPDTSSYQNEEGLKAWDRAYTERNKKFVEAP